MLVALRFFRGTPVLPDGGCWLFSAVTAGTTLHPDRFTNHTVAACARRRTQHSTGYVSFLPLRRRHTIIRCTGCGPGVTKPPPTSNNTSGRGFWIYSGLVAVTVHRFTIPESVVFPGSGVDSVVGFLFALPGLVVDVPAGTILGYLLRGFRLKF